MNRKSPFAIVAGVCLFLFVVLSVASQIDTYRMVFELSGDGANQLKVQLTFSLLLPISMGVVAILSNKIKPMMFAVTLYTGLQVLNYLVVVGMNFSTYFNGMNPSKYFEIVAYAFVEAAFILSIVHDAMFKIFRGGNQPAKAKPEPEYDEFGEEYKEEPKPVEQPKVEEPKKEEPKPEVKSSNDSFQRF